MHDIDDHDKQERIRAGAVGFVLVMMGISATVILLAPSSDMDATKSFLMALVIAIGLALAGWLLHGMTRGERLVFAPQRWVLWLATVTSALALGVFLFYMFFRPERLYTLAHWPMLVGTWSGILFVPESTARKRQREGSL